jgi:hypothetical protein
MLSPVTCSSLRSEFLTINECKRGAISAPSLERECDQFVVRKPSPDWNDSTTSTLLTCFESVPDETFKRVRFAEDGKRRVLCHRIENYEPWTEHDVRQAWHSRDELDAMRDNCRQESTMSFQTQYHSHYMQLYHACGDQVIESEHNAALLKDGAKSAIAVAQSEFRGYERGLYHGSMRRIRKDYIAKILDAQDDYWENHDPSDAELPSHLAALCKQMGKRSRRIAFLIGFGDSVAAEAVYASR